jgi:hypothetical protein
MARNKESRDKTGERRQMAAPFFPFLQRERQRYFATKDNNIIKKTKNPNKNLDFIIINTKNR